MRSQWTRWFLLSTLLIVVSGETAHAQYSEADTLAAVAPGLVYREYSRIMTGNDWRVTDPDAPFEGPSYNSPSTFLPNPELELTVDDLQGAIRAVAVIDVWGGHVGTIGKQFRLNDSTWIDVPDIENTPSSPECYVHQVSLEVEVPLEHLVEGMNVLEGTSGPQTCFDFGWGQWGWYGFMLRIYYDPLQKAAPAGNIVSPADGGVLRENPMFEIEAMSPVGVTRVDLVGLYDAYDADGDGVYREWQQNYHRPTKNDPSMVVRDHMGTATTAPHRVTWDTQWIPDQDPESIEAVARIRDSSGLWFVTDRVTGLSLDRPGVDVRLYRPSDVPRSYWVRAGRTRSSTVQIASSHDLTDVQAARLLTRTWNGIAGQSEPGEDHWTRVNGWTTPTYGVDHFYAFDQVELPVGILANGTNQIEYYAESTHHGVEVLWPGPAVVARFEDFSDVAAYVSDAPDDAMVVEGQSATFSVSTLGAEPTTYQWQRDGVDIDGATDPTFTTPPTTAADDGARYRCVVSNAFGGESSPEATLTVLVPGPRVTDGQLVLYTFEEAGGDTVFDRSGTESPADLVIEDTSAVTWSDGALTVDGSTVISTSDPPSKVIDAARASNAFTIEAWIEPANTSQTGPARILTLSSGPFARNFLLGQGVFGGASDVFDVRFRSTGTDANGQPSLTSPEGSLETLASHVVFTRRPSGTTSIFVDGVEVARGTNPGDLSNWDETFRLALGNELSGDRPWSGTFDLVALFGRALSSEEVVQNFAAGPAPTGQATSTPPARGFDLAMNRPNPFNPRTSISFELPAAAEVSLAVFDLRGRRIIDLVRSRREAGVHHVVWDGRDARGSGVSSGVYLYRIDAVTDDGRTFRHARRMTLLE